jgi:hypothetical protein
MWRRLFFYNEIINKEKMPDLQIVVNCFWLDSSVYETDIGYSLKIRVIPNFQHIHPKSRHVGTPQWIWDNWVHKIQKDIKSLIMNDTSSQLDFYFGKSIRIQCIYDNKVELMKNYPEEHEWEVSIENKFLSVSILKKNYYERNKKKIKIVLFFFVNS